MLTVDDYGRIRRSHRDGMSIREIARRFGHAKKTVRKALANAEPTPYVSCKRHAPKLGPFTSIIDEILEQDEQEPPKQRHFSTRIFDRLRDEHGYAGGYDQVRRYVRDRRERTKELFVPLRHEPGQRVECDFGQIHVDFPDGRRPVAVLLMTWAYSHCPFVIALPSERTESILSGMVEGFAFFGCCPREVWWDNPKTVATAILHGRERTLHERYRALASHYRFEPLFCMPARGNEKPHVENRVKRLQRHWATPAPQVRDLAELNVLLRRRCEEDRSRTVQRKEGTIGERFEQERVKSLSLPERAFDPCVSRTGSVDKYQTVRFDTNAYSVPRRCAFGKVTIKAYPDSIAIVHEGQVVARHARSYGRHEQILEPVHYLVTLSRKPALLDHTNVYRDWKLPSEFDRLRRSLEGRIGARTGARHYIRVLQLLADHPAERIAQAIARCRHRECAEADHIGAEARRLREAAPAVADDLSRCSEEVRRTASARPGLSHFDRLLNRGDPGHG